LVAGTTNSFTGALLQDAIPFNWGDGTSYNYTVKDNTTSTIAFGVNDWVVDTEAGILMFNNSVPANMPPTISFYRYSGAKGITNSFVSSLIVTGTSISGNIGITGVGGTNVFLSGQNIVISGGSSINTGQFVTTGQTGSFVTSNQTGSFVTTGQTGAFYPLTGNPSSFVSTSQTGAFASIVNLVSTGAFLQSEIAVTRGTTGSFTTTSQTGQFYASNNPIGYITSSSLSGFITTGSGDLRYLQLSNTGNFIGINQTGQFFCFQSYWSVLFIH